MTTIMKYINNQIISWFDTKFSELTSQNCWWDHGSERIKRSLCLFSWVTHIKILLKAANKCVNWNSGGSVLVDFKVRSKPKLNPPMAVTWAQVIKLVTIFYRYKNTANSGTRVLQTTGKRIFAKWTSRVFGQWEMVSRESDLNSGIKQLFTKVKVANVGYLVSQKAAR